MWTLRLTSKRGEVIMTTLATEVEARKMAKACESGTNVKKVEVLDPAGKVVSEWTRKGRKGAKK